MVVSIANKRNDLLRNHRVFMCTVNYQNGDTSLTVDTGLKKLYSYTVSPTSVATKTVTRTTVASGVLTITATDPLADCYLTVTAFGIR